MLQAYAKAAQLTVNAGVAVYNSSIGLFATPKKYRQTATMIDIPETVRQLAAVLGQQVLVDGIFSSDPHPGNVMLLPDGRLGLIDFGQAKELSAAQRAVVARTVVAVASGDEQAMLDNYDDYGPIAVSVDASQWQFYDGGRTNGNPGCTPITSCGRQLDHEVEIIGTYNYTVGYVDGWVIRNHWGTAWGCALDGEGGYAMLAIGNTCGIAEEPYNVFVE